MNVITLLLLAIIVIFTVMGLKVGLIRRVVEFVGLLGSFVLAMKGAPWLVELFGQEVDLDHRVALYTAWVILFLAGLVATRFLAWGLRKIIHVSILGWVDRLGGAVFGALLGILLASVILIALTQVPGADAVARQAQENPVARVIYRAAPTVYAGVRKLGGDHEEIWDQILAKVDEHRG